MKRKFSLRKKSAWLGVLLLFVVGLLLFGKKSAPVQAKENLMNDIVPANSSASGVPDKSFVSPQADFSVALLRAAKQKGKNSLISPVSVSLALGMTANGAQGNTLKEFENVLGNGLEIGKLNRDYAFLSDLLKPSKEGTLLLRNSVWYRNGLSVRKDFLQTNADYFGADAYRLDFSDASAPDTINRWVRGGTNGKIDKIVNRISPNTVLYLINTLYLEQDWAKPYTNSTEGTFYSDGGERKAQFLNSAEVYLSDGCSKGILKPLKDPRFAFAAVLPNRGSLSDYLKSLTGKSFLALLHSAGGDMADAKLPAFRFDCSLKLRDPLISLGLPDAFDGRKANFGKMADTRGASLFLSDVFHKTHISLDRRGLTAAAATSVEMAASGTLITKENVDFDRPFLFAVIDRRTLLPLFLGTVESPGVSAS